MGKFQSYEYQYSIIEINKKKIYTIIIKKKEDNEYDCRCVIMTVWFNSKTTSKWKQVLGGCSQLYKDSLGIY